MPDVNHDTYDHTGIPGVGGSGAGYPEGTSFPGSPATNDKFYRTDLNLLFFYDGTRWLTTTLYTDPIPPAVALPISATATVNRVATPLAGSMDIWLENFWLSFLVSSGGTALGASHKWVCVLAKQPANAALATVNIDSGASNAHRNSGAVSVAAVVATSEFDFGVNATKTGSPGTLYSMPRISYRLIGT